MSATIGDDGSLYLAKQIVYLDFDGEETVYKNDALGVEYSINVSDSLITEERQAEIVEKLNEQYNGNGIYFTNTVLLDFVEFSTIYVGRPDGLPEDNDIFGLSETIDVNNQISNDNAFVFFDHRADDGQIISVINHELEHIVLGEQHFVDKELDILDYAASGYMLNTTWGQGAPYNNYCPVDPVTGERCVTGCTNTAAAQIIYYWLENGALDLQLTVDSGDNYDSYSRYTGANITISSSEYMAQLYGYLSFAKLNNKLANFTVNSSDSIAALCFAAGIVQGANYSSDATGTAWSSDLFIRSGFEDSAQYYGPGSRYIYSSTYGYGLTDSGWSLLCNELLAGRPVGVSLYACYGDGTEARHAIVADGYNSSTKKVHLNYGWSGGSDGWYSLNELNQKYMLYQLVVGITPEFAPFLKVNTISVSNSNVNQRETFTVNFTVSNTGTATSTATEAYVYAGGQLLQTVDIGRISAGAAYSYSCTVDASKLNTGNNTITVSVTTPDTGKNNSQSTSVNVVNTLPDLQIRDFAYSVSGNTVDVTFSIANTGAYAFSATTAQLILGDEIYKINIPSIQANGQTQIYKRSFWGVSAGTHYLSLYVDSEDAVEESDEDNNCEYKFVSVTAAPDFVPWKKSSWDDKIVTSIVKGNHKNAETITADDEIYIDFGAINAGNAYSSSLRTNLYVDGQLFDYYLEAAGLDSGSTKVWEDINIGKFSAGTHTLTIETRNSGNYGAAEANTSNNTYTKTITVAPGAPPQTEVDLAIVKGGSVDEMFQFKTFKRFNVSESTTPIYDMSDIYMQAFIKNIGAESAGDFTVSVLVDGKTVKSYACPSIGYQVDTWYDYDFDHEHYFGSEAYIYGTVMHIWDCHLGKLSAGTHTITVVVDSMNAIRELDETNNSYSQTLTVLPTPELPNLLITDVWLENSDGKVPNWDKDDPDSDYKLDYGADATLKFTIKNIGNGAAGESKTSLHWGVNYEEFEIAALAPGESKTYSLELPYLFYSTNNFYFNVNCDNAIQEVIEYDNEYRRWCEYGKYNSAGDKYIPFEFVDLITTHASLSVAGENVSQCLDSENITVDFTIENIGSEDYVSESVNVDILVDGVRILRKSISGELDDYIDAITFKPTWDRVYDFYFDQDEFVPYEYHFDIGTLTAGEHVISIVVDPDNESNDTVRANNRCDVLINVEKSPDTVAPVMGNVWADVSGRSVTINWNAATDDDAISFYKVVIGDSEYTIDALTMTLENLSPGTCEYQVVAYDMAGNASQAQYGTFHIAAPDLCIDITEVERYVSNDRVYVKFVYTVTNQGDLSAEATKNYVMLDGDYLQTLDIPALNAEQSVTLECTLESDLLNLNRHYITMQCDGENSLKEENESDNKTVLILENVIREEPELLQWAVIDGVSGYMVEYSGNDFKQSLKVFSPNAQLDMNGLPDGSYQWRYCAVGTDLWINGKAISVVALDDGQYFCSNEDQNLDLFFGNAKGKWDNRYAAQHRGMPGWSGTGEFVQLNGENKILDIFSGSSDANILVLTDDANGDALFIDDIYSALPESITEQQARLQQINEIRAGAGNDIIDMTSQRFSYYGSEMTIRGGAGNDVIWATGEDNDLFGDAGNDRIIGSTGFDLIVGGAGDDVMQSGGGNDIFAFCSNWGNDIVEITDESMITLWFENGSINDWDSVSRIYSDGVNSVTVIGSCKIDLKFGNQGGQYEDLAEAGAFLDASSEKIFEDKDKGFLA